MLMILSLVISYLLGSISFSYFVGKKVGNIDIRKHGSGNAGATNTLRVLGKGPAIVVLLLDALKGMLAMWITSRLTGGDSIAVVFAGIFAIVGHNWPVYFGFRGGKGIATTLGVIFYLSPLVFLIAAVVTVILIYLTRYVSLGSLVFVTLAPLLLLFYYSKEVVLITLIITVFAYIRHYQNIVNLIKGKERKLGDSSYRNLH